MHSPECSPLILNFVTYQPIVAKAPQENMPNMFFSYKEEVYWIKNYQKVQSERD